MARPGHHWHRSGASLVGALACALATAGCAEAIDNRPDGEVESLRLGRVHVVVEPAEDVEVDAGLDDAQLQVTARFAFVRGLDEDFVRARIDMPVLAQDILRPGKCGLSDMLGAAEQEPDPAEPRELVLVDAGDVTVHVGEAAMQVPVALVPDLLPYMSGVEYMTVADLPVASVPGEGVSVRVSASGSLTEDLPPFAAEGRIPSPLDVFVGSEDLAELREGALVLRWQPAGDDVVTVRITPLLGSEPAGDEITCVLADRGEARIDLGELRTIGLPPTSNGLKVAASRIAVTSFDAGDFAGSELVLEHRDAIVVPLE